MLGRDSITSQIAISVLSAVILGVVSFVAGRLTAPNMPPTAVIKPDEKTLAAGEFVQFSAEESSPSNQSSLTFNWQIGGQPANKSSVGTCLTQHNPALAFCQFVMPGTFSVAVTVKEGNGLTATATAPVTVSLPNGYFGVVLFSGRPPTKTKEAYRIIMRVIDWQKVQQYVSRPIVIYDPDRESPVFASSLVSMQKIETPRTNVLMGVKLLIPPLPAVARKLIQTSLEDLGASVLVLPINHIPQSLESGYSDSGLLGFSSPEEYILRVRPSQ